MNAAKPEAPKPPAAAMPPAMPPMAKAAEPPKTKEGMAMYSSYYRGISITLIVLFFVLSPGVLLTIPAGSRGLYMSRQTSVASAAVHAVLFAVLLKLLRPYF